MSQIEELREAIAALEAQRATLGDAVVDTALTPLREKLAGLEASRQPEQQRKLVTILFLDIVNSTVMIRDLDPEDTLAIMDGALKRLTGPVEQHGGRVAKYTGDGLLALFGHPVAHENDAEMAVRAGLAMLDVTKNYADDVKSRGLVEDFAIRIGVNTGLAIIGGGSEGKDSLAGSAINLAARLESAAPPGGLLISHHTCQQVRGIFNIEEREPVKAKGFEEPQAAYLVTGIRPPRVRQISRGVEGVATRMIGRDSELTVLQDAFDQVVTGNECQVITVVGEAGIGKSRLRAEFAAWLDVQSCSVRILKGKAMPQSQGLPYGLLRNIFATEFDIQEDESSDSVRKKFEDGLLETFDQHDDGEMKAHYLGQLLGFDFRSSPHLQRALREPKLLREMALNSLNDYLNSMMLSEPVILFLEDFHWADGSSLDVVEDVAGALSARPLLLIAFTRPGLYQRRPEWGDRYTYQRRLDLHALSERDSQLLLDEVLQKLENIPDALRDLVVANAEGNPFYVEELVKMLIEEGVIRKAEPHWQVQTEQLHTIKVPPSLTGVLQARLDRLSPEVRTVLQQASVVGRVFWDAAVAAIHGRANDEATAALVGDSLNTLRDREMVFQRQTSAFAGTKERIFKHAVLRDVTYETVLQRLRLSYHALVADWLIENSSERLGEMAGVIAAHLERANRESEAVDYLKLAGDLAISSYANEEAIDYIDRAISLIMRLPVTPERQRQELDFQMALYGPLQVARGWGTPEVAAASKRARELAEQVGEAGQLFHALYGWWAYNLSHVNTQISLELAQQCMTLAESVADPDLLMEAHRLLDETLFFRGDFVQAREQFERGYALYDPQQHHSHATVYGQDPGVAYLGYGAMTLWFLGYPDQARAMSQEHVALGHSLPHAASYADALSSSAGFHHLARDVPATRELAEAAIRLSNEQGFALSWAMASCAHGWALAMQGQAEDGIVEMRQGLDGMRAAGAELGLIIGASALAEAYGKAGRIDQGLEVVDEGLELSEKFAARAWEAELHRLKGELLHMQGKSETKVEASYNRSLDLARRQQARSVELRAAVSLARLWQEHGKRVEAYQLLSEIYAWFSEGFDTVDLKEAGTLLEELSNDA
jgi:class 3 adenylate cyclase/tetratricopeptide (TPR) repeat protein